MGGYEVTEGLGGIRKQFQFGPSVNVLCGQCPTMSIPFHHPSHITHHTSDREAAVLGLPRAVKGAAAGASGRDEEDEDLGTGGTKKSKMSRKVGK